MLTRACCACDTRLPERPGDVDAPDGVSHGYCKPCFRAALAEVRAMRPQGDALSTNLSPSGALKPPGAPSGPPGA